MSAGHSHDSPPSHALACSCRAQDQGWSPLPGLLSQQRLRQVQVRPLSQQLVAHMFSVRWVTSSNSGQEATVSIFLALPLASK